MRANLVHSYVMGNKFNNIYGSETDCSYGHITHIKYMTPFMKQKYPWLKGKWYLDNAKGYGVYCDTLREAKQQAQEWWPGCFFKTPKQFRDES